MAWLVGDARRGPLRDVQQAVDHLHLAADEREENLATNRATSA